MTVPTLFVCLYCGYPQPGRHSGSCPRGEPTGAYEASKRGLGWSDREDPPVICAAGLVDDELLALRLALRQIQREATRPVAHGSNALWVKSARLDAIAAMAGNALASPTSSATTTEEQS